MHGDHEKKAGPPLALLGAHAVIVAVVVWLLLGDGLAVLDHVVPFRLGTGPWARRMLLASMSVVYLLRFTLTSLVLLRRRMEWAEVAMIVPWLAFIHLALGLLGGSNTGRLGLAGVAGVLLYGVGSYLNTASEWDRMRWKAQADHAGKLYTGGLFAWARHVNYLGDIVLFTGFAMVAGAYTALLVPVLMTAGFATVHVPVLDAYLAERYGADFTAYARRTKRLLPGIW